MPEKPRPSQLLEKSSDTAKWVAKRAKTELIYLLLIWPPHASQALSSRDENGRALIRIATEGFYRSKFILSVLFTYLGRKE